MMEVPYHYQFRLIVIGDTMVGKSSLLKTFSEGSFGEMEPTVGVDFFSKIIQIRPKQHSNVITSRNNSHNSGNIIVKLQIWDTAGQERFKSIVNSYYRNSVGIILVYDVTNRESYDHLIDWFTEARDHVEPDSPTLSPLIQNPISPKYPNNYPITSTPNSSQLKSSKRSTSINSNNNGNHNRSFTQSLNNTANNSSNLSFKSFDRTPPGQSTNSDYKMSYLILGCKTDLEAQRQVSYEDGKAFADMYGFKFIETSSKTLYNVNKAFQLLAEEIYEKITDCGRLNRLHRTASGCHLTFDLNSSQINEGIKIGPLIESDRRLGDDGRVRLLEAQPVSGFLGGCC